MLRGLAYLLGIIFLITIIRALSGLIGRAVGDLFQPSSPERPGPASASGTAAARELKKDPVCGIYVSTATKLKKTVGGKQHYFCSETCRDKFKG
jgi:YHS domain-containing protein